MSDSPVVEIKQGRLRGKIANDLNGRPYYSFQGIPYAKPPLGDLRFKAPQPADPWTEVLYATKHGNESFSRHMLFNHIIGNEDCLFLNIYTPTLPAKSNNRLPVMVWIHGGGFTMGSGNNDFFSPEYLLPQDVVVVTINYRLGLLGFLNFEDPSIGIPGNAGLKDQVMALKWVRDNISEFNGNPENVTIFGESAGGASVHYLILSPMAKGLFHKAIIQSGTAFSHWAITSERPTKTFAKLLNCESASEREIFEIINKMSSEEVLQLQEKIPESFSVSDVHKLGPVVEKITSEEALIVEHPISVMKSGNYNRVPIMIGYCSGEGLFMDVFKDLSLDSFNLVHTAAYNVPKQFILAENKEDVKQEIATKIKDFYFGGKDTIPLNSREFDILQGDLHFVIDITNTLRLFLANSEHPVYLYRVSLETELNFIKKLVKKPRPGVCHADELFYLFKSDMSPSFSTHSLEAEGVSRFTTLWTSFARSGNPNPAEDNPLIPVTWPPATKENLNYLEIGENLTVGVDPDRTRIQFWDEIYKTYSTVCK